jgi:hypothetical protein
VLVEESQVQGAGAVEDHRLLDGAFLLLHRAGETAADLGDHRDVFARRETRDRGELTLVGVPAWVMPQQVANGSHTQLLDHQRR